MTSSHDSDITYALDWLVWIADRHPSDANPDQQKFHAGVREAVESRDLQAAADLIDAGFPLLSRDGGRGVFSAISLGWVRDWRLYAGEVLGEAERAA